MFDLREREWPQQPLRTAVMANSFAFAFQVDGESFSVSCSAAGGSETSSTADVQWVGPEQHVFRVLVDAFKKVPQVQSICAQFGKDEAIVWTLLDKYDRDARESVYEQELRVCQGLRIFDFDFRVTSTELISPAELVRGGSVEIYKRP